MANKSQLNQMSKKQILQSLAYQQQSDYSTLNRMMVALARTAGVSPEDMARNFTDHEANSKFADSLNQALDREYAKKEEELGQGAAEAEGQQGSELAEQDREALQPSKA